MADSPSVEAWNNFVLRSRPDAYGEASSERSAAIACQYMNLANGGGINSFLTCSWDLDASEVLDALRSVGAFKAAKEFEQVLSELGVPLPRSSQEDRFDLLDRHWPDALDEHDFLSDRADKTLCKRWSGMFGNMKPSTWRSNSVGR